MYQLDRFKDWLKGQSLGQNFIGVGKFEENDPMSILLTQEAGGSSPVTIKKRSVFESDSITIRVIGDEKYTSSQEFINKIYNLLRDTKQIRDIGIINLTANQPTLINKVKGKGYKFAMLVDIIYDQTKII